MEGSNVTQIILLCLFKLVAMLLQKTLRLGKSFQLIRPILLREYRVVPVIKYDLTKPVVDLSRHDPEGQFSPSVLNFIKARDFENSGGKKVDVISLRNGEKKGTVEVNDFVFGANPRIDILHRNMVWYRACIRSGTACTKRRSEVRGGGKKPWRQKGSGRARHGSIRSPLWRKGGSVKGPKPRDYSYQLPYRVRRMGLRTALSCRLAQGDLTIVEDLSPSVLPQSSHEFEEILMRLGLQNCHIVDGYQNDELDHITKDIENVTSTHALFLHVYGILIRHKLVLSLNALRILDEKLCEDNRIVTAPQYELYHQDMMLDKKLLFHEYDPKSNSIIGRFLPKAPKKSLRKKPPMSRQDLKK